MRWCETRYCSCFSVSVAQLALQCPLYSIMDTTALRCQLQSATHGLFKSFPLCSLRLLISKCFLKELFQKDFACLLSLRKQFKPWTLEGLSPTPCVQCTGGAWSHGHKCGPALVPPPESELREHAVISWITEYGCSHSHSNSSSIIHTRDGCLDFIQYPRRPLKD